MRELHRLRLPRPSQSLSEDGRAIADQKISDLIMDLMLADYSEADYKDATCALQLSFWTGFWKECDEFTPEVEEKFMLARKLCSKGVLLLKPEQIEEAEKRGQQAVYDWAGNNWRPKH